MINIINNDDNITDKCENNIPLSFNYDAAKLRLINNINNYKIL